MPAMRRSVIAPRITLLLGLGLGCAATVDAEFRKVCLSLCQSLNCADGVDVTRCTHELVQRQREAARLSEDCDATYRLMIECAAELLGCSEVANWGALRGSSELEYPCRAETDDFLAACPDLWF